MSRPVTLVTGQWADLPLTVLAEKAASWGYDGLELACWGDHLNVRRGARDRRYCEKQKGILEEHNLQLFTIGAHLIGQLVCDPNNDVRSDALVPADCRGKAGKKRAWAVETMKAAARAAKKLGIDVVTGFTGSSIWHLVYDFPPTPPEMIDKGYEYFAKMWNPILDVFDQCGVRFALEPHPTEIAYDIETAHRALEAVNHRETFGFNFDPSHLQWQMVDPVEFLTEFKDRIYHVHMKDAVVRLNGRTSILNSHLPWGHRKRGWDFRSLGHGDVNFEEIIRELNDIGYEGPLSVEWEDTGMDREHGAREACEFVRNVDFQASSVDFDAAFEE